MAYRLVKPIVKGAQGPLTGMSTLGKLILPASSIPYIASYWFIGGMRLAAVTIVGLILSLTYLLLAGDFKDRIRPLAYIWGLSVAVGVFTALVVGGLGGVVDLAPRVIILSTLVFVFLTFLIVSLALLRINEFNGILKAIGLGSLAEQLTLLMRYLLNASMNVDEAYIFLRLLGKVRPKPLLNSALTNGLRYSIAMAQYIALYGVPLSGTVVLKPRLIDIASLIPLAAYLAAVAAPWL